MPRLRAAPARSCRGRARPRAGTCGGPERTSSTNRAWWRMSSRSPRVTSERASGRSMVAAPPPAPYSKERNSGSMSSQLPSRLTVLDFACTALKSGARNGFDICICRTDAGTTCFSTCLSIGLGSTAIMSSSGLSSTPAASSRSRRSALAAAVTGASSASSPMRLVSRAAVLARMPASPSRRFCSFERSESLRVLSVFTRARSSRSSSAATWKRARLAGFSGPFCTAASTSRAARARIGMTPTSSPGRTLRRCPPRCADGRERFCWPACGELAKLFSLPAVHAGGMRECRLRWSIGDTGAWESQGVQTQSRCNWWAL